MTPLVSMVIAAYERPIEIAVTIHCLLAQTLQDFEIIVVHDGPGERVRDVVRSICDHRIVYCETPVRFNDWGNSSKEYGTHMASGQYIGHTNDDNYYAPLYLAAMVHALQSTDSQFALCNMVHSHHGYNVLNTRPEPGWIDGGGWLCDASVVKQTPWPEPKSFQGADGLYAHSLASQCQVVKTQGILFVHN